MAQQNTAIPIRNSKTEPISWPNTEETMLRALPTAKSAKAKDIYRSSLAAAGSSFRVAQRKTSAAAASINRSVRHFADERPLHFVGVVAGVAFLAGVTLRIWRSTRHA